MVPPERAYAADRSHIMGGPLATAPQYGNGGSFNSSYAVSQIDPDAPLNRWQTLGAFASEQECTDYKAQQIAQVSDPAWIASEARKSPTHLVDASGMRDLYQTARCVNSAALSGK